MPAHVDNSIRATERQNAFNFVRTQLELFREEIDISYVVERSLAWIILNPVNPIVLSAQEGDVTEIGIINELIRVKIFHMIQTRKDSKKPPSARLTNILMVLANYWPLNVYKYNEETDTSAFECPLSKDEINDENKIIFPSGTQFSKSMSLMYFTNGMKNGFKDLVTTKDLTDDDKKFWMAQDRHMLQQYYNSDEYKEYKSQALMEALESATARFVFSWAAIFFIGCLMIVFLNIATPIIGLVISAAAMSTPLIALIVGITSYFLKRSALIKEEKANLSVNTDGLAQFDDTVRTLKNLPPSYNNSHNVINHELDIESEMPAPAYEDEDVHVDPHQNTLQEDRRRGRLAWLEKVEKKIKLPSDSQVQPASRALN